MSCFGDTSKEYFCCIKLLDDTELNHDIPKNIKGQVLLEKVYQHLNLIETDYFGLRYLDEASQTHWLDGTKSVAKQVKGPPYTLYFGVKFYVEDPCKLKEEITRYQFFLQLKKDMLQGRLPCTHNIAAELCAFCVQSELGDYDSRRNSYGYISEFRFVPSQTEELENQIMKIHKTLKGELPCVAEMNFLERVKWLDMYGVDLHPVKGQDNIEYFLGLTPTGVVIYKSKKKVASYFWPRITKVHFKHTQFILRVIGRENTENEYYFELASKLACRHLWRCCVEQHAFFRLPHITGQSAFSSSKFRHSGRTQKEAIEASTQVKRSPPKVSRLPSKRYMRRASAQMDSSGQPILTPWAPYQDNLMVENGVTKSVAPEPVKSGAKMTPQKKKEHIPDSSTSRSTKSVPWEESKPAGLYTPAGGSPVSVRSSSSTNKRRTRSPGSGRHHHCHRRGSGSEFDSDSSYRKHRHCRKCHSVSDTESDHHVRRRRRRSGSRSAASSGSDSDQSRSSHKGRRRRRRRSEDRMVESEDQWRLVQRRQEHLDALNNPQHSAIIKDLRNGSVPTTEDNPEKRWRIERSRSIEARRASSELKKHFTYGLVDPDIGQTESDLNFIPYTSVETEAVPVRITTSPKHRRHRSRSGERSRSSSKQRDSDGEDHCHCTHRGHHRSGSDSSRKSRHRRSCDECHNNDSPPPPYSRESTPKSRHRSRSDKSRSSFERGDENDRRRSSAEKEDRSRKRSSLEKGERVKRRSSYEKDERSSRHRSADTSKTEDKTVIRVPPNAKPLYVTAVYQALDPVDHHNTSSAEHLHHYHQSTNSTTAVNGVRVHHSREDSGISNDGQESSTSPKNFILLPVTIENAARTRQKSDLSQPIRYSPPIGNNHNGIEYADTRQITEEIFPFGSCIPKRSEVGSQRSIPETNHKRPSVLSQNLATSIGAIVSQTSYQSKYDHSVNYADQSNQAAASADIYTYRTANQNNSNVNMLYNTDDVNYERGQFVLDYLAAHDEMLTPGPVLHPANRVQDDRSKESIASREPPGSPQENDDVTSEDIRMIGASPGYNHELSTEL